jgi:putative heme-binding domain-containing protein
MRFLTKVLKAICSTPMPNLRRQLLALAAAYALAGGTALIAQRAAPADLPAADASRGRTLMDSNKCFDCHRIGDRGSRLGPNLSDIGDRRTPDSLRQALVAPDAEVIAENRFVRLVTAQGATITGRLLNQDAFSVQLITPGEELKTYMRAGLRDYAIVDTGLMPSVEGKLTDQQIADIVAYLASLKAA